MIRRVGLPSAVVAMAAVAVLGGIGTAMADPGNAPNSSEVPLVCDGGATYTVVVNGNGQFAAAHDVASNATLIPTAFGPFHGVITDEAGNVVDEFTDPAVAKGSSTKTRTTSISCTYTFDETFTDPELGVLTFHGDGSVIGFSTPAR
jgi:hypothetical protein